MKLPIDTPKTAWQKMTDASIDGTQRNWVQQLDMSDFLVETQLFPREVLETYSAWNLGKTLSTEQLQFFSSERGGGQGDYREGMRQKIENVIDCLTQYPQSKRALIVVANNPCPHHSHDDSAKCMRELQLYYDDQGKLSGTVFFRAQAALIFPKNIHFIGSLMQEVATALPDQPQLGTLFYLTTLLVSDRS